MNITIISNVAGCRWAGSEQLWLQTAKLAIETGDQVSAHLNADLHSSDEVKSLVESGGHLFTWRRSNYARLEPALQWFRPNFSNMRDDVILVSLGSLPAIRYVPGLAEYLIKTRTPYVLLCQFNSECLPVTSVDRDVVGPILERAASVVFVSEQNKTLARRQYCLDIPNSCVICNPIRVGLSQPIEWPDESVARFACVARLETLWKCQDLLLEVLASSDWRHRDWQLGLFGSGPDEEHVRNAIRYFGLSDKVIGPSFANKIEEVWRDHHLLLLPSRGEGTPLAALEAMMCGRPVITTDVGGNAEILTEGITGYIAEAATPASFGAALERAWHAKGQWPEMGLAAHWRAKDLAAECPAEQMYQLMKNVR